MATLVATGNDDGRAPEQRATVVTEEASDGPRRRKKTGEARVEEGGKENEKMSREEPTMSERLLHNGPLLI